MKKLISLLILTMAFTVFSGCTLILGNEEAANEAVEKAQEDLTTVELEESDGEYDLNLDNALKELELVGVDE